MISLMMFSGGIDSTYSLVRLLNETQDEVLVHHVHLVTNTNRHVAEQSACAKIVEHCQKNIRAFSYTESVMDRRKFVAHGYDFLSAGFEAGIVSASYYLTTKKDIDRWIVGWAEDDIMPRIRFTNAQDCCEYNCQAGSAPELFLYQPIDVQEQINYMGAELFNMTWSCRAPKEVEGKPEPCKECDPCLRRLPLVTPNSTAIGKGVENKLEILPWRFVIRIGEQRAINTQNRLEEQRRQRLRQQAEQQKRDAPSA